MGLDSRLKKLETIIATRGGGHPTVMRLTLRNQRFMLDSAGILPDDWWKPLDPGPPDSLRRSAFDLACKYDEARIWREADRRGLRAELEALLGRGPLTAEELAAAEAEFFHPLSTEEFCQAELRRTIIEAAAAAGEPCPWWLDRLEDDLTSEQVAEVEAWLAAHLAAPEADATPSVDSEGLSVPTSNDTTTGANVQHD